MSKQNPKRAKFEQTVAGLQGKYGAHVVHQGQAANNVIPPHLATGFTDLDAMTGCGGIPVGHISLLTGKTTSGKLTLAYKLLEQAQGVGRHKQDVAILDLTQLSDWDYIARCGVDMGHLRIIRPPQADKAIALISDLLRGYGLRVLLIDGLGNLLVNKNIAHAFDSALPQINVQLKAARCALVCLDEPQPPWLRWLKIGSGAIAHYASIHLDLKREQWLMRKRNVVGYVARAHLIKSRWARSTQNCEVAITFNGTVTARN